jgi:hypothetical protein
VTRTVRRTLAASAAALTLLATAGCGGDDEPKAASDSTSTSAAPSESASDTPTEMASEAAPSEDASNAATGGEEVSAAEFGDIMKKALDQATTANVTTTNGASGLNATGQVDYSSDPPSVKMTATIAQMGDIDVILVDNVMYMKGAMFGADKYVKLDLKDPSNPLAGIGDQLDPAAAFEKLVKGITSATYVGEEDVNGESLKHYATTIDSKVLLEDLPSETQGQAQLPDAIDYQWWFDGDGLIRKFSADMGGAAGTVEGTFDDWGTKVDIKAPPASQVTTIPGM